MKKTIIILVLASIWINVFSQKKDSTKTAKYPQKHIFGRIYTGFFNDFSGNSVPSRGFEFSTGIFGLKAKIDKDIETILIYDVTRTTSDIQVFDSANHPMNVLYFEGSRYTAFLKMAEIDWHFAPQFKLSVGQILNDQYLTVQDRFWGYRFVAVTLQEMYRFGNPADFGMRLTKTFGKKAEISIGAVNGDGPFHSQGADNSLLFFSDIQYKPSNFLIKWYSDLHNIPGKQALHNSLFAAWQKGRNRVGLEYARIDTLTKQYQYTEGMALYSSFAATKKFDVFFRSDILNYVPKYGIKNEYKIYAGVNYHKSSFNTSINIRYYTKNASTTLYWQFGIKF